MPDAPHAFAGGFPPAAYETWRALADAAAGERGFESALVRRTLEGLVRGPLMTGQDRPDPDPTPALRSAPAPGAYPWDIRALVAHPDPAAAGAEAVDDLEGGASSIELRMAPSGTDGVLVRDVDDLATALSGVLLDIAPVSLDAGAYGREAAGLLCAVWTRRGIDTDAAQGAFNLDPLGVWATNGAGSAPLREEIARAANFAAWAKRAWPQARALRADGRIVHEAGGSSASELAFAAAAAAENLRALMAEGLPVRDAACLLRVALSADADIHQSIVKLRAWRRIWARIAHAFEASDVDTPLDVYGSRRMLSRDDPWTNMVRLTCAGFAAAVGGADAIALPNYATGLGVADAFAKRQARNVQMLVMAEAHVGRVADPAFGGFHHEALTDALAREAWSRFQDIETAGGLASALQSGMVQARVAAERAELVAAVAHRRAPLVGVSAHALLDGRPARTADCDVSALRDAALARDPQRGEADAPPPDMRPETLIARAHAGVDIDRLLQTPDATDAPSPPDPLAPMRLSQAFEALREAAGNHETRTGSPPKALVVTLGALKDHEPRLSWTRALLAAGGVACETHALEDGPPAYGDGRLIILCGDDAAYEAGLEDALTTLGRTDASLWLAGRGDPAAQPRIDRFLHAGADAIEALEDVHAALGVSA